MRYRVNSPHVIAETVGGETTIVNLGTGHYFSLQGSGVDVWDALERGVSPDGVVRELSARYADDDGVIERAVADLVEELVSAELVVAEEGDAEPASAPGSGNGERRPFVAPTLTTYTDMQDIILLDPVHEVDPSGWPHAAAGA